ncbi:hypothetical protein [Clostridium hydrogenum]|nr:hypothetical protein [Clostridium hydrogenum]
MKNNEDNKTVLEEVKLDEVELLEDAVTPSFGFACPHGWFGAHCH